MGDVHLAVVHRRVHLPVQGCRRGWFRAPPGQHSQPLCLIPPRQADEQTRTCYEHTMAQWLGCEAIVRQREKESHAAALAKCSSGASLDSHLQRMMHRDSTISNEVRARGGLCSPSFVLASAVGYLALARPPSLPCVCLHTYCSLQSMQVGAFLPTFHVLLQCLAVEGGISHGMTPVSTVCGAALPKQWFWFEWCIGGLTNVLWFFQQCRPGLHPCWAQRPWRQGWKGGEGRGSAREEDDVSGTEGL